MEGMAERIEIRINFMDEKTESGVNVNAPLRMLATKMLKLWSRWWKLIEWRSDNNDAIWMCNIREAIKQEKKRLCLKHEGGIAFNKIQVTGNVNPFIGPGTCSPTSPLFSPHRKKKRKIVSEKFKSD